MNKKCSISTSNEIFKEVIASLNSNSEANEVIAQTITGDSFSKSFLTWVSNKLGKNVDYSVTDSGDKAKEIAKQMIAYRNNIHASVNATSLNTPTESNRSHYGYSSEFARREGMKHVGVALLDIFNDIQKKGITIKGNKLVYYTMRLQDEWLDILFNIISNEKHISVDDLKETYNKQQDKTAWLDSMLGGDNKSVQNANKFAIFQELFSSNDLDAKLPNGMAYNSRYMKEVLANTIMDSVRKEMYNLIDDTVTEDIADASQTNTDDNPNNDENQEIRDIFEGDYSVMQYDSHGGMFSTYLKHIGPRIANYFNTLRKITTSGDLKSYDTENDFGIADTMDAIACSTMIYSSVNCNNIYDMLADIRRIANQVPGFEAFAQLANDLETDLDFAAEFRTVFNKIKMSKTEVVTKNETVTIRQSNQNIDKNHVMINSMYADANSTFINNNYDVTNNRITNLWQSIDTDRSDTNIGRVTNEVVQLLKSFFPSLQTDAIRVYISSTNKGVRNNQINNIKRLLKQLETINKAAQTSKTSYHNMLYAISEARTKNKAIAKEEAKRDFSHSNEKINISDIYAEGYLSSEANNVIRSLTKMLAPLSVINIDLNSRNIYGNNSSDIINNSHIGMLHNMMQQFTRDENDELHNDVLLNWVTDKLQSSQYRYSSILLEQRGPNGIVSYGLVRESGSGYVLTEYADTLLQFSLFNGSSNLDTNTNVGYAKMTEGDYLPTSFMQTCGTELGKYETNYAPYDVGNYFLRTPSDDPKQFISRMPLYSTQDLFVVKDEELRKQIQWDIVQRYGRVFRYTPEIQNWLASKYANGVVKNIIPTGELSKYIHPSEDIRIMDESKGELIDAANEIYRFEYFDEDGRIIFLQGKKVRRGDYLFLVDTEYAGILGYNNKTRQTFESIVSENPNNGATLYEDELLYNTISSPFLDELRRHDVTINGHTYNQLEYTLNREHPVVDLLQNIFRQEMIDAMTALNHYFEFNKFGEVKLELDADNNLLPMVKADADTTKGYNFYHLKDGKLFTTEEGIAKLLGNVFNSSKFKFGRIVTNENGNKEVIDRNYLGELISQSLYDEDKGKINLLYGSASGTSLQAVIENGKVVDVIFTQEQQEAINNKLEEFLNNYIAYVGDAVIARKDSISGVEVNDENITKYAVNQFIAHTIFDELFDGDTKFYKDGRTVLKRAKQDQGSGVPYGIANNRDRHKQIHDLTDGYSFLNDGIVDDYIRDEKGQPIKNENGKLEPIKRKVQDILSDLNLNVKQRNGFRAVTIANSKNSRNATFDLLVDILVKDSNMSRDKALDLIYGPVEKDKNGNIKRDKDGEPERSGGFTNTKVNDAQSYITFEEWIRRIAARGQLQRYLPLIRKIRNFNPADKSTYLTASEISEFVQVQKNFYYDTIYDSRYGIYVPRQIKNAEFVLIPQFIEGTQLERVYKMMKAAGIDQLNTVETSKASNETILKLWDNDGNISEERYQNFANEVKELINEAPEAYSYWYDSLYTQQETPQHMNEKNKAGIQFLKKIIDNVPETTIVDGKEVEHPMHKLKTQFFDLFSTNIEESLVKLCDTLEIPRDSEGNIILDAEGKIQGLDNKQLYDKLLDELMRTGLDKNLLSFCELDEFGQPKMSPIMNNIISKFESIVQSVFNHSITRQELPGFHAAQVTNVGFKSIREQGYEKGMSPYITYDKKLKYHVDDKGDYSSYIEIMVPLSWLGIDVKKSYYKKFYNEKGELDKKALLAELAEKELDKIIGYRIPTEGKQSICNMKVVGLLDDSQGSTIIVPDEWVAQTGSDFDIDSVYTIQWNTITKSDGEIKKVQFIDNPTEQDYLSYVRRETETKKLDRSLTTQLFDRIRELRKEAIDKLPVKMKASTLSFLQNATNSATSLGYEGRDALVYELNLVDDYINNTISVLSKRTEPAIAQVVELLKDVVKTNEDARAYLNHDNESFSDKFKQLLEEEKDKRFKEWEKLATDNGLLSYSDFISSDNKYRANSKEARDNKILEICQTILSDPSSLEENLSRSNCEDIVRARNEAMSLTEKDYRKSYSPYDVIAQIKYQDDAMSGADLKALSVTLDNLCSVCNTVKPYMRFPIRVLYDNTDRTSLETAKEAYDEEHIVELEKQFEVTHDTYGWTANNRNISGKILTAYSSQTTALILDAIKEGNIPNVNTYSFGAFKTLVNCGLPYEAAIPFIMQPAITMVMDNQKALNSVFNKAYGNPVVMAVRDIAEKLNIKEKANAIGYNIDDVQSMSLADIMDAISDLYEDEFNEIFKTSKDSKKISLAGNKIGIADIPLLVGKINDRINERGEFAAETEKRLLFDLGNILLFNKLNNVASQIGDIGRVLNPDKFGAKQTVYATRKVFDDIDRILFDREKIENIEDYKDKTKVVFVSDTNGNMTLAKKARPAILFVKNDDDTQTHILESVYPGCRVAAGDVDSVIHFILDQSKTTKSSYPSLYAMLRCASITSCAVAKKVFDTQRPRFVQLVNGLASVYSDNNVIVDEATYNDFQKYVIQSVYTRLGVVRTPIEVNKVNGEITYSFRNDLDQETERKRIYGINYSPTFNYLNDNNEYLPFKVADKNEPTEAELRIFERFSPAQKIQWIKSNFEDPGIFAYVETALYNDARAGKNQNMQTINFIEQNANTNDIFDLFSKAFHNSNPLIVSAVIDVVKYAAQVEGFRMTKKGIMKIIDNSVLYNDLGAFGLGFNSAFIDEINDINNGKLYGDLESTTELYENYLRSHPNAKGIKTVKITNRKASDTGLFYPNRGMYIMHIPTHKNTSKENRDLFEQSLTELGVGYKSEFTGKYHSNKYVRFIRDGKNTLYKIIDKGHTVFLYPLSNLQTNEVAERSIKPENNEEILSKKTYEKLVIDYIAARNANSEKLKSDLIFVTNTVREYKAQKLFDDIEYVPTQELDIDNIPPKDFNLQQLAEENGGTWSQVFQSAMEHFSDESVVEPFYTYNQALGEYILSIGGVSHQEWIDANGKRRRFYIARKNLNVNDHGKYKNSFADWYLTHKNTTDTITNPSLKAVVDEVKSYTDKYSTKNNKYFEPVYEIGIDEEEYYAADEVIYADSMDFASSVANVMNDDLSSRYVKDLDWQGIDKTEDSLRENAVIFNRDTAEYATNLKNNILDMFNKFCPDAMIPNTYHNIKSDEAKQLIRTDRTYEEKAYQLSVIAKDFIEKYGAYESIDTDNNELKFYHNTILEAVKEVRELPLAEVDTIIANTMADRVSTNPLIKNGLIDVMDGFWKSYGNMWQFNDIAENGTPILQMAMKEMSGYIEAQRLMQMKANQEYRNNIKRIINDAKTHGYTVDIQKLVDAGGRFIQNYKPEFLDKYVELSHNVGNAIDVHGRGSIEHLKAKIEYDEFLARHVNQEVVPAYYWGKVDLLKQLVTYNPRLAEEYYRLYYKRADLYRQANANEYTPELHREIMDVTFKLKNLTNPGDYYYDFTARRYLERPDLPPNTTPAELGTYGAISDENAVLYNPHSARYLMRYEELVKELNKTYFDFEDSFGFEQQLNDNLEIIRNAEQTQPNGLPGVPLSQLVGNKEYQKAKKWLKKNAMFVINSTEDGFDGDIKEAKVALKLDTSGRPSIVTQVVKNISQSKDIYDELGILDGTKLTEAERQLLKDKQNEYFLNNIIPITADRALINNAHPNRELYNVSFYQRLAKSGNIQPSYYVALTELNGLLSKYYDANLQRVCFDRIPKTARGIAEIRRMGELYQELRKGRTDGTIDAAWVESHVTTVEDDDAYNDTIRAVNDMALAFPEWGAALIGDAEHPGVLYEHNKETGEFILADKNDPSKGFKHNRFLFSYSILNPNLDVAERERYLQTKTEAQVALLNRVYRKVPTVYWYQAMTEAENKRREDERNYGRDVANANYNEWLEKQYVYNPYTKEKELISCWTTMEYNPAWANTMIYTDEEVDPVTGEVRIIPKFNGEWVSMGASSKRVPKEHAKNPNFKQDLGNIANFAKGGTFGGDTSYDSEVVLNPYEIQMRDYLQNLLERSTKNEQGVNFFKRGYLPIAAKPKKPTTGLVAKELLKTIGIGATAENGKAPYYSEIGFSKDRPPVVPMTTKLGNELSAKYKQDLEKLKLTKPLETEPDYATKLAEWEQQEQELKDKIEEIHRDMLNRDWYNVIGEYLNQISRYNAIQENKMKMFWLLNTLKNMKMYERKYGSYGDLKKDNKSSEDSPTYIQSTDGKVVEQLETYMHRMLYDQWKESEGALVKFANMLQTFTSANYMTMNVKGGIANVTLGATGMLAEAAAGEYFGRKTWGFGTREWKRGVTSYARRAWNESFGSSSRCYSKQDAIIKAFDVVDYDDHRGVVRDVSLEKVAEGIRNFTYSPQTMGEHFMQNSVLFAMLKSHKLVTLDSGEVVYMNETEYLRYKEQDILKSILTDEQRASFVRFKDSIKADKNTLKDYAWFRKDALTEWVILHCDKQQQKEFGKARREKEQEYRNEFEVLKDIYSQLELNDDGEMGFVAGSQLARLDEEFKLGTNITKARMLCGYFTERVRKVNNKIHGVYNREGAANIEKEWYGSLIMQYHKHLPIGLLKRYRARGLFNETRGSVEKGLIQSIIDFISLDFRNVKLEQARKEGKTVDELQNLSDKELGTIQGLQMFALNAVRTLFNLRATWNILPQYERANLARNLGDLTGTALAFAALVGLWAMAGADDDLEDSWLWNLGIYEFDRLASESFMYNPWGLFAEGKKLMSTPISSQSIIGDAMNVIGEICKWMFDDEYDSTFKSGRFAGENRLWVYLRRRIPIYSSLNGIADLINSNSYYKVANSYSTIFGNPKRLAGVKD